MHGKYFFHNKYTILGARMIVVVIILADTYIKNVIDIAAH